MGCQVQLVTTQAIHWGGAKVHKLRSKVTCLHSLRERSAFLGAENSFPELCERGKLHFVLVFAVDIEEDSEDNQQASPYIPAAKTRTHRYEKLNYTICTDFTVYYCGTPALEKPLNAYSY